MLVSLCPLAWLPRYPSTLTTDRRVNKNAGHHASPTKGSPSQDTKIPPHMRFSLPIGQAPGAVSLPNEQDGDPTQKWQGAGLSAPEKTRPLTLHPANPFLCRRRKSANQPKLTDDQLTSTMSPTLNFDSVLDRTERRRRRLMVAALVLYRGTIGICSILAFLCVRCVVSDVKPS